VGTYQVVPSDQCWESIFTPSPGAQYLPTPVLGGGGWHLPPARCCLLKELESRETVSWQQSSCHRHMSVYDATTPTGSGIRADYTLRVG
jgi:hypothetical protein